MKNRSQFLKRFRNRRNQQTDSRSEGEGFFSPDRWKKRVTERRSFRVKVSGNRKWIAIGVAVVAVCGTIIYLSITYGGSIVGFLK